jgi:hypothetical protein
MLCCWFSCTLDIDAHIGKHVEMASQMRVSVYMLNTIIKNQEEP